MKKKIAKANVYKIFLLIKYGPKGKEFSRLSTSLQFSFLKLYEAMVMSRGSYSMPIAYFVSHESS